jgi:hypothetical protein
MAATRHDAEREQLEPSPLIGRDEMNLAEFPIALLADRAPDGQKTLYFEDQHGRLTITASDAYGLPTAIDTDVIVSLIYLTKLRNEFKDTKINFSRYEIIKLLNWIDEGKSYKRLDLSLNRWSGVLLVYDKCWWNNKLKCYTSAKMHIIENVEIIDNDARRKAHSTGQTGLPLSYFTWDRKFIESCQADNLRQLNLDEYFSLKSAVAKRLYRFLGKRFYVQRDWTFDLNEIAFDRIGLSRSYADAGKIKEKLQPAIDELESIGFLRPLTRDDRYNRIDRGQWTIRLTRQSAALVALRQPAKPEPKAEPAPPPLVLELIKRGVSDKIAADLVRAHDAETIRQQIEILDWRLSGKKADKIADPAAWLVSAINHPHAAPKGFVSAAERQRQQEAKQAKERAEAEERRRQQQQAARERAEDEAIAAYRKALTSEALARLEADAIAQASEETRQALDATHMAKFRKTMVHKTTDEHIRQLLRNQTAAENRG